MSSGGPLCPLVPGMAASGVDLRLATARAARVGIKYHGGAPRPETGRRGASLCLVRVNLDARPGGRPRQGPGQQDASGGEGKEHKANMKQQARSTKEKR